MVNGSNHVAATGPISGGDMTATAPPAICHGSAGPGMGDAQDGDEFSLHALMDRAGVRMPPGRAEASRTATSAWTATATRRKCRSASSGTRRAHLPAPAT